MQYVGGLSDRWLDEIKNLEGKPSQIKAGIFTPYKCPAGRWTIGYGSTIYLGQPVTSETPAINETQAENAVWEWCLAALPVLGNSAPKGIPSNEIDACWLLIYNIGAAEYVKNSSVCRLLKAKAPKIEVANAFLKYDKIRTVDGMLKVSQGLLNRRIRERLIFLNGWAD